MQLFVPLFRGFTAEVDSESESQPRYSRDSATIRSLHLPKPKEELHGFLGFRVWWFWSGAARDNEYGCGCSFRIETQRIASLHILIQNNRHPLTD